MNEAWITVREAHGDGDPVSWTGRIALDDPVTVGRTGRIHVGVAVPDNGVSRLVATIAATAHGWAIRDTSRNGIVVHPWGLAPIRAADVRLRWPLVGVRVHGTEPDARHWLLLECDRYEVDDPVVRPDMDTTVQSDPPRLLTPAERQALATVFEAALAWPPPLRRIEPLQLKQAARRLGITASAVKVRLEGARAKAELLGLDQPVGVTDPTYVHTLVAAGYLRPPARRCGQEGHPITGNGPTTFDDDRGRGWR